MNTTGVLRSGYTEFLMNNAKKFWCWDVKMILTNMSIYYKRNRKLIVDQKYIKDVLECEMFPFRRCSFFSVWHCFY